MRAQHHTVSKCLKKYVANSEVCLKITRCLKTICSPKTMCCLTTICCLKTMCSLKTMRCQFQKPKIRFSCQVQNHPLPSSKYAFVLGVKLNNSEVFFAKTQTTSHNKSRYFGWRTIRKKGTSVVYIFFENLRYHPVFSKCRKNGILAWIIMRNRVDEYPR